MSWVGWEFRRALRSRAIVLCAVLLIVSAAAGYLYGRSQVARQLAVISELERLAVESDQVYFQERFKDDENIGRACYYLTQPTAHLPLPEASLSLGQRDLHSYHQVVRLRSLYANLFDSGFFNPSQAAAGHFDLSFVLVYLLPLLVIAVTFDVLSSDRERRTLPLLRASNIALGKLVLGRLLVRFLILGSLCAILVASSLLACGAPAGALLPWLLATLAYLAFWFSLATLVCGMGWSSARNAGALLGLWTLLTVLGPALLNLALPRDATRSGAAISIRVRQVINNGWDIDKETTAKAAIERDPRYRDAPVVQEKYSWSWYFAMHDAGDAAVEEMARNYFDGLEENYQRSVSWSLLLPPVRLQLLLDEFSATDLMSHMAYYRYVEESRLSMRDEFLPRVFQEEALSKKELLKLHQELGLKTFEPPRPAPWSRGLLEMGVLSGLLAVFSVLVLLQVENRIKG